METQQSGGLQPDGSPAAKLGELPALPGPLAPRAGCCGHFRPALIHTDPMGGDAVGTPGDCLRGAGSLRHLVFVFRRGVGLLSGLSL